MVESPLVSAVITTRNRLPLLKRAVTSVYSQTYENIELIVVDDGSDDGTEEWCSSQEFHYIRIPIGESRGGNYARNLGIKASVGDYIAFLDDDDYWLPEKTVEQLSKIQQSVNLVVYTLRKFEFASKRNSVVEPFRVGLEGDIKEKSLYNGGFTSTSTLMVRRKALYDVGLWDEDLGIWQDNDLIIRLAQANHFVCIKLPMTVYWIDERDKAKLSNKYFEWKKNVTYLRKKHHNILNRLSVTDKLKLIKFYVFEAAHKAGYAGLHCKKVKYQLIYALLSPGSAFRVLKKKLYYK